MAWMIWKSRNDRMFQKFSRSPTNTIARYNAFIDKYFSLYQLSRYASIQQTSAMNFQQPQNVMCIDVDGGYENGRDSIGGAIFLNSRLLICWGISFGICRTKDYTRGSHQNAATGY